MWKAMKIDAIKNHFIDLNIECKQILYTLLGFCKLG